MRVVIVGAGIVGAALARTLARRGVDVVVVERGRISGGTSAAGEGNILVSDKGPGAELALAQYASSLWPKLAEELADELGPSFPDIEFDRKGGLVVALTEAGAVSLRRFAATQRTAAVEAQDLSVADALKLEPWLSPAIQAAVRYPEDAQVQPVIATEAMVASARRAAAVFREAEPAVAGIRNAAGQLIGVRTPSADLYADAVVVASGPWSGEVSRALGAPLPVLPRRGVVLVTSRMPHRIFSKVYDADYVGAVGSGARGLQTSSVVESTASGTVLIGSSRQQVGFDSSLDVRVLSKLADKAIALFPFLSDMSVMRSYGGFRPFVPDHLPVIGKDPRLPGLWHATGHEGAGIGLSIATAELLADLLTGQTPRNRRMRGTGLAGALDVSAFSPARPSLAAHLDEVA